MTKGPSPHCPSCGAELSPEAVLCIACGYHLKLGRRLDTTVEAESKPMSDDNPYAPPVALDQLGTLQPGETPEFDLPPEFALRAGAIVSEAKSLYLAIILASCICGPAWFIMLPWYAYRLSCWYRLNNQFAELRHPNSLSSHGRLAVEFQDAKLRLWIGVAIGLVFWTMLAIVIVIDMPRLMLRTP